jgi:NAD(P)-dependent dehydrogenase (short-subunit alcohol dehydrogenase family)
MAKLLEGQVAIVTGAGRGIGRAHALALAAAGAQLVVNDVGGSTSGEGADDTPARQVADEAVAVGGIAIADDTDISDWSGSAGLIARTVDRFGKLDILVNNAGICRATAFGSLSEQDWDRTMDVNAKAMTALIDAAARYWREAGPQAGRSVVCTASPSGTQPHAPLGIYGITKAAVLGLAQVCAQELAPLGVRVNALCPTARTRMVAAAMADQPVDVDRIMPQDADYDLFDPAHVARLVLYLVSPLCPFTGRAFGVRADDVYVFDSWDAVHHVDNGKSPWNPEELAAAMISIPLQENKLILGPMGTMEARVPDDETMATLHAIG